MARVMEKPNQELIEQQQQILKCPRCDSSNTKFCYYNNYSLSQPRHFCKACKRYWTRGGTLRNVPVGGGCRKNKRLKRPPQVVTTTTTTTTSSSSQPPQIDVVTTSSNHIINNPLFYDITYNHLPLLPRYEELIQPHPHHMIMNNNSVGVGLDFTSGGIMYGHDHENGFSGGGGGSNTASFQGFGSVSVVEDHHQLQIAGNKSGEEGQQNRMGWPNNYNYQMEHVP